MIVHEHPGLLPTVLDTGHRVWRTDGLALGSGRILGTIADSSQWLVSAGARGAIQGGDGERVVDRWLRITGRASSLLADKTSERPVLTERRLVYAVPICSTKDLGL